MSSAADLYAGGHAPRVVVVEPSLRCGENAAAVRGVAGENEKSSRGVPYVDVA